MCRDTPTASLIPSFPPNRQTAAKASSFFLHGDQAPHFHLISASPPLRLPCSLRSWLFPFSCPLCSSFTSFPAPGDSPTLGRTNHNMPSAPFFLLYLPSSFSFPFAWVTLCFSKFFKHVPFSVPSSSLRWSSLWLKEGQRREAGEGALPPPLSPALPGLWDFPWGEAVCVWRHLPAHLSLGSRGPQSSAEESLDLGTARSFPGVPASPFLLVGRFCVQLSRRIQLESWPPHLACTGDSTHSMS